MTTLDEVLLELRATRAELRELRVLIEARAEGPLASDAEVDGKYGDPVVRFDPKSWKGPSFKDKRMSECSPEYLDELARAFTQMAASDDAKKKMYKGKPASTFSRKDAARARRWALRKRCGWTSPVPAAKATNGAANGRPVVNPFGGDTYLGSSPGASPFESSSSAPAADDPNDDRADEDAFGEDEDLL